MGTPTKIWIQTGLTEPGRPLYELDGVTWSKDQIHDDDAQYIRADIVEEMREAIQEVLDDENALDYRVDTVEFHNTMQKMKAALKLLEEELHGNAA